MMLDIDKILEKNFTSIGDLWWKVGKKLGKTAGGNLAHMPTAASYNSDFGQMLAWIQITKKLAATNDINLCICDDPWIFRQLSLIDGVTSSRPPKIWPKIWP